MPPSSACTNGKGRWALTTRIKAKSLLFLSLSIARLAHAPDVNIKPRAKKPIWTLVLLRWQPPTCMWQLHIRIALEVAPVPASGAAFKGAWWAWELCRLPHPWLAPVPNTPLKALFNMRARTLATQRTEGHEEHKAYLKSQSRLSSPIMQPNQVLVADGRQQMVQGTATVCRCQTRDGRPVEGCNCVYACIVCMSKCAYQSGCSQAVLPLLSRRPYH